MVMAWQPKRSALRLAGVGTSALFSRGRLHESQKDAHLVHNGKNGCRWQRDLSGPDRISSARSHHGPMYRVAGLWL